MRGIYDPPGADDARDYYDGFDPPEPDGPNEPCGHCERAESTGTDGLCDACRPSVMSEAQRAWDNLDEIHDTLKACEDYFADREDYCSHDGPNEAMKLRARCAEALRKIGGAK